ncbi:hypothetical protein JD844_015394 [Phrynosoma platyrhinos]|uniref:Uncharacterized protein n=1 Tax=Phrynosoma platyrhinos TaxID=52577 RepID=A0ABQ7SJC3_PHRPL|nr:hypothetical protein JD844_015394 [Phrynosoma platyrhinos]
MYQRQEEKRELLRCQGGVGKATGEDIALETKSERTKYPEIVPDFIWKTPNEKLTSLGLRPVVPSAKDIYKGGFVKPSKFPGLGISKCTGMTKGVLGYCPIVRNAHQLDILICERSRLSYCKRLVQVTFCFPYLARCGFRGGYMEVINMDPGVQQQLTKLVSVRLCPPVTGQILVDVVVNQPQPGDPSYQQFSQVSDTVANSAHKGRDMAADGAQEHGGV